MILYFAGKANAFIFVCKDAKYFSEK